MKDFLENELNIGDRVVYCKYNKTNASLLKGIVEGITTAKVRIAYDEYGMRLATVSPEKLIKYSFGWEVIECE